LSETVTEQPAVSPPSSDTAVMVAAPGLTAVTSPCEETVATSSSEELHVSR